MALMFLFQACQQVEVCEDATATKLRIGFYRKPTDGPASQATIDSLTVYLVNPGQDTIYDNKKNVSRIELYLNPGADSTAFVCIFPGGADTIQVQYDRKLHLISVDCGFTMFYTLHDIHATTHQIGLQEITNNLVSNTTDEHVKIYFTPSAASR